MASTRKTILTNTKPLNNLTTTRRRIQRRFTTTKLHHGYSKENQLDPTIYHY